MNPITKMRAMYDILSHQEKGQGGFELFIQALSYLTKSCVNYLSISEHPVPQGEAAANTHY